MTPSFSSDDYVHLEHNIHYQNLGDALEVFVKPFGREYRPMVRLSLWLNYQMSESAVAFKLTNLGLHLISVVLLYLLLIRLQVHVTAAFIATAIFAVHPIHSTSVHFILGRTDLLAAVFYLATLVTVAAWKSAPSLKQYLLTSLWFFAALLSKELSVTLPLLMLAVLVLTQENISRSRVLRSLVQLWPFFFVTALYLGGRFLLWKTMPGAISVYTDFSPINVLVNYTEWAFGLLYPFDLYVAKEWQALYPAIFAGAMLIIYGLVFGAVLFFCWPSRKMLMSNSLFWLGLFWLLITLLPMSGGNAHRWYLYLPSAGLSLMIAALWQSASESRRIFFAGFLAGVFGLCALETARQSYIWEQQSILTQKIIDHFESLGLHRVDELYMANVPFGYKSAYLFTFHSLEEAIRVKHGKGPKIHVLSYMNIDDEPGIEAISKGSELTFNLIPNPYRYAMLSASERRFAALESREIQGFQVTIVGLDSAGRITQYRVNSSDPSAKLHYFIGDAIFAFRP